MPFYVCSQFLLRFVFVSKKHISFLETSAFRFADYILTHICKTTSRPMMLVGWLYMRCAYFPYCNLGIHGLAIVYLVL